MRFTDFFIRRLPTTNSCMSRPIAGFGLLRATFSCGQHLQRSEYPTIRVSARATWSQSRCDGIDVATPLEASFQPIPGVENMTPPALWARRNITLQFDLIELWTAAAQDVKPQSRLTGFPSYRYAVAAFLLQGESS